MNTTDDDSSWTSHAYIEPAGRPAEWARMAAALADQGRSVAEIADALCVDEPTAAALLGARLERVA